MKTAGFLKQVSNPQCWKASSRQINLNLLCFSGLRIAKNTEDIGVPGYPRHLKRCDCVPVRDRTFLQQTSFEGLS